MARSRYRTQNRSSRSGALSDQLVNLLLIGVVAAVGWLAWPSLVTQFQARTTFAPSGPTAAPTLAPAARELLQQAAPNTAAEQQQIQQPPAIVLAIATPAPLPPPAAGAPASAAEPSRYSPVDLGWAPIPTPTTMLSPEQYDASQASEEQNFLNNAEAGLTEAQKLVNVHAAEQNAQAQP